MRRRARAARERGELRVLERELRERHDGLDRELPAAALRRGRHDDRLSATPTSATPAPAVRAATGADDGLAVALGGYKNTNNTAIPRVFTVQARSPLPAGRLRHHGLGHAAARPGRQAAADGLQLHEPARASARPRRPRSAPGDKRWFNLSASMKGSAFPGNNHLYHADRAHHGPLPGLHRRLPLLRRPRDDLGRQRERAVKRMTAVFAAALVVRRRARRGRARARAAGRDGAAWPPRAARSRSPTAPPAAAIITAHGLMPGRGDVGHAHARQHRRGGGPARARAHVDPRPARAVRRPAVGRPHAHDRGRQRRATPARGLLRRGRRPRARGARRAAPAARSAPTASRSSSPTRAPAAPTTPTWARPCASTTSGAPRRSRCPRRRRRRRRPARNPARRRQAAARSSPDPARRARRRTGPPARRSST